LLIEMRKTMLMALWEVADDKLERLTQY